MEIAEIYVITIAVIIGMMASFCAGMYACTQIGSWIDKRIKK